MKCIFIKVKVISGDDGMYGIEADLGSYLKKYPSITRDREEIERIARLINEGEVSVCHIDDVIEDILG